MSAQRATDGRKTRVESTTAVQMPNRSLNQFLPLCATLLLVVAASPADAQETGLPASKNGVYLELLGNGGLYSLNYERAVTGPVRVRAGAAAWTAESVWSEAKTRFRTFPMMLQIVPGSGAHHLEAGVGVLLGRRSPESDVGQSGGFVSLIGLFGYRYEPPGRRIVVRAGFTPFYGYGDSSIAYPEKGFLPSLGFSLGARF